MEMDEISAKLDSIKSRMEEILVTKDTVQAGIMLVELLVLIVTVENMISGIRKEIEKALTDIP